MVPVCAAVLIALGHFAKAEEISPADLALHEKGFGALQVGTRTFTADIVQILTLQGIAKPVVSKGVLSYASPDHLLIRFSQPAGEWMIVDGTRVAVQKQGKSIDVRETSGQGKSGSHAVSLLDFFNSGPERWHQSFDVSMTREGDRLLVHLKPWMTPTSTFQGVKSITTALQLPGYELLAMEIAMSGSNQIRYEFSNVRRNTKFDPALFAIPKEATP